VTACVVIPTVNARDLLLRALGSLAIQVPRPDVIVVDNASTDGTTEAVAMHYPWVEVRVLPRNLGFGRAIDVVALDPSVDADVLILVNNDVVCEPGFVERICAPFADPAVGMVAGVLLQETDAARIDSAGIELDRTLQSFDYLSNASVAALGRAADPVGPCGGAAAYRLDAFRAVGGFDDAFFAYWEDVDLALRLRLAGWECRLAPDARAVHRHGATLGALSPGARRLEAYGRGYVLERYCVARTGWAPLTALAIALLDWPALLVHLVVRREAAPIRARLRGRRAARRREPLPAPVHLATVPLRVTVARQWGALAARLTGRAPGHYLDPG
jgi:GT2 family glycosyltransferase